MGLVVLVADELVQLGHHRLDVRVREREHAEPTCPPSSRCRTCRSCPSGSCSSRSVPARISRLRSSSGRTACASFANGSRRRIISVTPTYRSGTICTENPGGSERVELPSWGTTLPRDGDRLRHDHDTGRRSSPSSRRSRAAEFQASRRVRRAECPSTCGWSRCRRPRVDRVILVEDVAQNVADDFAQVRAFEIEDDAAAGRLHRRPGGNLPPGCMPFTTTPEPL